MISRRQFLIGTAAVGATGIAGFATGDTTENLVLEQVEVPVRNLSPLFDGYKIGFLTDVHFGVCVSERLIKSALTLLADSQMDLLLLGGDYLWVPESGFANTVRVVRSPQFSSLSPLEASHAIFESLSSLIARFAPRDGIWGVFGNHDRWTHPTACQESFNRHGIPLLKNDSITVERGDVSLEVVGVDDYWTGIPRITSRKGDVRILLSHNPDYPAELGSRGDFDFDLALSGHTHGGQIRIPGIDRAPLCNIYHRRYTEGLVPCGDGFVYTSRGIGVVEVPYRYFCPPEVTLITLKKGDRVEIGESESRSGESKVAVRGNDT